MNTLRLVVTDPVPEPDLASPAISYEPIGRMLVDGGKIAQTDLLHALKIQGHVDAPLGEIMVSEGLLEKRDVLDALAAQCRAQAADLDLEPPTAKIAATLPAKVCLRHGVVPWKRDGLRILVATSSPADFAALCVTMRRRGLSLFPVIADEVQIQSHLSRLYGAELAEKAVTRVSEAESCRSWAARAPHRTRWLLGSVGLLLAALIAAPAWTITLGVLWAVLTLAMTTTMKAAAFVAQLTQPPARHVSRDSLNTGKFRLPRVSVLVPLLNEKEIAGQLIVRLSRLTYPKSLLNVVLVLEEGDETTRQTIARTELPDWMSVIEVPGAGALTTKPRALNYALDFCRGSIVGVWDAEDWPEADQIERVVTRFHHAPENVVCLQGVLDYYNSRTNWLSRCFTIEYATWWRVILPGIAKLGLVLPLGGTTLFFRREALEDLGGWDAHNVTEDADLGVRLARHGYVTELLPTVTHEEATSRAWPWVRQRSRWLKGFMITYFVHMRNPRTLLRDLGLKRFLGVQTMFLATFSQFAAAPLLWSFWLTFFGVTHPVELTLGAQAVWVLAGLFVFSELLSLGMGLYAVSGPAHRHLTAYVPTMMLYFTLGALAAYKALWEMIRAPFFWDKTQHGVSDQTDKP
ncbi:glycosyltransferase family 2 protein [Roseobacter sinensis]|uniref:Glycosyltransferase n=1 Tax=Roseobacter sinensis TaxID=2931391 RepID=A0ABT3B9X6_9RHOB|nr:glycosyltransferase family 2 protein [Roseobacter sp. WL0113]MCV3270348.1 glycosyltransferase [Roseobacter sp. WL0113]